MNSATIRALVRRDVGIARSYRATYILDLTFSALNLGVFFYISKTFGHPSTSHLQGAPTYFAFAVVGLAITTVTQSATVGLARKIREEQLTGTLEVLVTQPIRTSELALGLAGFPFLFAMSRTVLYFGLAVPWLDLGQVHTDWIGAFLVFAISVVAITAIGIGLGAVVIVLKRGEAISLVAIAVLGAFGGALFPVQILPSTLEWATYLMPTRPMFEGIRAALFGTGGWETDFAILAAFTVAALPFGLWLFDKALEFTRRTGSLSQY